MVERNCEECKLSMGFLFLNFFFEVLKCLKNKVLFKFFVFEWKLEVGWILDILIM